MKGYDMVQLTDYLYSGDTLPYIIRKYARDLKKDAQQTENAVDLAHCEFLLGLSDLLEHNDFLTSQSQRIRDFYKFLAGKYPYLAFTFRGRIKSLIRAEEKFNAYIVEYTYEYYTKHKKIPPVEDLLKEVQRFRDLIAYRIVISLPKYNLKLGQDIKKEEIKYLYKIANELPDFLEARGFTAEVTGLEQNRKSELLRRGLYPFYRDYVESPKEYGYQSLHIALQDNVSGSHIEVQLRTKYMDDHAEIGNANHADYENHQQKERSRRETLKPGISKYFDDAYVRMMNLAKLNLAEIDVNMFAAIDNHLINDGCGLYRGRLILPYEHLSKFQNDRID